MFLCIGHNSTYWYVQHPFYPTIGGHTQPAVAFDVASGWSITQTVTTGQASPTPTSTPTVPEFPLTILPLFASMLFIPVILWHRKTANLISR
jgi:hypothetical protein